MVGQIGRKRVPDASQNISKCLHVGNVPTTLTEKDLAREFEKYGVLETVKLVNQRGRRFAFVCYRTPASPLPSRSAR